MHRLILFLFSVLACAQSVAPPQFDVASIRPNNSGSNNLSIRLPPGARLTAVNATLRSLILQAYEVQDFQLSGGSAWLNSERFDIDAKGQGNPPPAQILQMLQTLLADRFQLTIHREFKELPIYALLIAKDGPKLTAARDSDCVDPRSLVAGAPPPTPEPGQGPLRICGGFNIPAPGQMFGAKAPLSRLALNLSRFLDRTVVDKTGLDGIYDITLRWTPDDNQMASEISAPSLFTAVQEQLGLRLDAQKGPIEFLVIDQAQRPSGN